MLTPTELGLDLRRAGAALRAASRSFQLPGFMHMPNAHIAAQGATASRTGAIPTATSQLQLAAAPPSSATEASTSHVRRPPSGNDWRLSGLSSFVRPLGCMVLAVPHLHPCSIVRSSRPQGYSSPIRPMRSPTRDDASREPRGGLTLNLLTSGAAAGRAGLRPQCKLRLSHRTRARRRQMSRPCSAARIQVH